MANREELAWAAGLFEGEGSISIARSGRARHRVDLYLSMTDMPVVRRFHAIVGVGTVRERRWEAHPKWAAQLSWSARSVNDVRSVLLALSSLLVGTKQDKAAQALDHLRLNRGSNALKTHCPKGHPYDEKNTAYDPRGWRACRACRRDASKVAKPCNRP